MHERWVIRGNHASNIVRFSATFFSFAFHLPRMDELDKQGYA